MKINTEILTDYLNELCDNKTKQAVENWIKEDAANQKYFEELKFYWECKSSSTKKIEFDSKKAYSKILQKKNLQKRLKIRRYLQYAAAMTILIVSGITSYLFMNTDSDQILVVNNIASEKLLNLPDGSTILLAQGSSIRHSKHFSEKVRSIELTGEAFFNVAKDKNRPFIISTSQTQTQVIGTSFRISEANGNTFIKVESGIVEFRGKNEPTNKVRLVKGDKAKFMTKQHVILKGSNKSQNSELKIQYLAYQNESLKSICSDLNELFNVDIRLEGEMIPQLRLTTVFENQKLENILETISFTLDLDIEKNNSYILLK
ncbi:hypothetical protein DF185_07810 [Marinifilum breve]|uniref:FecR protein domain-containing protein n=1 Tax=Marinifilum breve TaxID=2184082 RepID=A0A2V3ZY37_9BACT|nr:FecR family protein [Marinifilum breve]PXY01382.1 hypothetical protein DF185_07810 [Marinifilum breve]